MNFDDELDRHKANFAKFKALVVLDDRALRRYVVCWGPLLVQRLNDWPLSSSLADLWACVQVDYRALADLTGDSLPQVMAYFRQAQGLQLIYPDGTVEETVTNVLRKRMDSF